MNYSEGRQPCDRFDPAMSNNKFAVWPNVHECFGPYDDRGKVPGGSCAGRVSFCVGCRTDHHSDGWDKCGTAQRIDLGALPYTGYDIGDDPLVRLSDVRRALGVESSHDEGARG